jgi:hypothetical protein
MLGELAVRGSVAGATAFWALAEWLRWRHPSRDAGARGAWTAGAALMVLHALAVFHFVHHWSQDAALEHTARQTAAVTGLHWNGGLYVNYAFIALWVGDALLWWRDPGSYERRRDGLRGGLLAIFLLMFINGGIVFAQGLARVIGSVAVALVLWAYVRRRPRVDVDR